MSLKAKRKAATVFRRWTAEGAPHGRSAWRFIDLGNQFKRSKQKNGANTPEGVCLSARDTERARGWTARTKSRAGFPPGGSDFAARRLQRTLPDADLINGAARR